LQTALPKPSRLKVLRHLSRPARFCRRAPSDLASKDAALVAAFKRKGFADVVLMDRSDKSKPFNVRPFKGWLDQGRIVRKGSKGVKGLFHITQTDPLPSAKPAKANKAKKSYIGYAQALRWHTPAGVFLCPASAHAGDLAMKLKTKMKPKTKKKPKPKKRIRRIVTLIHRIAISLHAEAETLQQKTASLIAELDRKSRRHR
jgi:hypothetical protein